MKKLFFALSLALCLPLIAQIKVLAISGSTRTDSYNTKLLHEAVAVGRQLGMSVAIADLKDYPMPFYNGDLEKSEGMPESAKRFRRLMIENDVILIACPEYNRSIPALLKNALDWASRSEDGKSSKEAFKEKYFALMSASPGKRGGAHGLVHLRDIIEDVRGEIIPLQVCIAEAHIAFDANGKLTNKALRQKLYEELEHCLLVANRN
jgi:NAD(P)H-dependent FMN reductase